MISDIQDGDRRIEYGALVGRTLLWRGQPHTILGYAYRGHPGAGFVLLCETADNRLCEVLADGVTIAALPKPNVPEPPAKPKEK